MYAQTLLISSLAAVATAIYNTTVVDEVATTVVTITSCSENKCHETAVTTGVTVVTVTSESLVTEYTTYCPLTSEAPVAPTTSVVPTSEAPVAPTTSVVPTSEAPVVPTTSASSVVPASNTTVPVIPTGAANKLSVGAAAAAGVAGLFLL